MTSAMNEPTAFYAVVFAGACHHAWFRQADRVPQTSLLLRLSYKTQAIISLKEKIQNCQGNISDDVLLAITLLATHEMGETLQRPQKRLRTPLSQFKDAEFYTSMAWDATHLDALYKLLEQRGGLPSITTHGLTEVIES